MRAALIALFFIAAGPALAEPDFAQMPGEKLIWHSPEPTNHAGDGNQFYACYAAIWQDESDAYTFRQEECTGRGQSVSSTGWGINQRTAKAIMSGIPYVIEYNNGPPRLIR